VSECDVANELRARLPGLERLWAITKGRPEIVIAVLDGPVDAPSVAQNGGLTRSGAVEHATHVYSIISGSGDSVMPGLAPGCTAISIPIFAAAPTGAQQICTQGELAAGIRTALERHANIINISASQQADSLSLSHDLSAALQAAAEADALVVAAAGNQGCACDTIPASVAGVLAVGAHGDSGSPLLSSNWGPGQRAGGHGARQRRARSLRWRRSVPRHRHQLRDRHGLRYRRPADERGRGARPQAKRPAHPQNPSAVVRRCST
jgi:subtilisin family serine protease